MPASSSSRRRGSIRHTAVPKAQVYLFGVFAFVLAFTACSDYEAQIDDEFGEWEAERFGSMTDSRDGQTYKTVTIGTQTWMAENLNYETENSYCYNDYASNCTKYGRLYTWTAATTSCPSGWHLPSQAEWDNLFNVIGGQSVAGKVLKSSDNWNSNSSGLDDYGFTVLPAGYRGYDGLSYNEGYDAYFWNSTVDKNYHVYCFGTDCSVYSAYLDENAKFNGFSVRCLKDDGSTTQSSSFTKISSSSDTSESSSSEAKSSSSSVTPQSSSSKDVEPAETSSSIGLSKGLYGTCAPNKATVELNEEVTWTFTFNTGSGLRPEDILFAGFVWAMPAGTPESATGSNSTRAAYAVSGPKIAAVSVTAGEATQEIECSPVSVSGAPITGCKCLPTNIQPDVSKGESAMWTANGCTSHANIIGYTWKGATADATGLVATAPVAAKGDVVVSVSFTVANDDNTSVTILCEDAIAVDGNSSSSVASPSSSSETSVSTGTITDPRDGRIYKTVTIGTQTWMAQNLNYETGNSYCYKDSASYCSKYGRLYTWEAATTACLDGWHLPTEEEFETLFTAVGGQSIAGQKLKFATGWTAYSGITNEDAFAFSALPAGGRDDDGDYDDEGNYALFWSSIENDSNNAYYMSLNYGYGGAFLTTSFKNNGFSVRCLKD